MHCASLKFFFRLSVISFLACGASHASDTGAREIPFSEVLTTAFADSSRVIISHQWISDDMTRKDVKELIVAFFKDRQGHVVIVQPNCGNPALMNQLFNSRSLGAKFGKDVAEFTERYKEQLEANWKKLQKLHNRAGNKGILTRKFAQAPINYIFTAFSQGSKNSLIEAALPLDWTNKNTYSKSYLTTGAAALTYRQELENLGVTLE